MFLYWTLQWPLITWGLNPACIYSIHFSCSSTSSSQYYKFVHSIKQETKEITVTVFIKADDRKCNTCLTNGKNKPAQNDTYVSQDVLIIQTWTKSNICILKHIQQTQLFCPSTLSTEAEYKSQMSRGVKSKAVSSCKPAGKMTGISGQHSPCSASCNMNRECWVEFGYQ